MSEDTDATSKRQIGLYKGRPVESMTREELIAAVCELGALYTELIYASFERADKDLRRMIGVRRYPQDDEKEEGRGVPIYEPFGDVEV